MRTFEPPLHLFEVQEVQEVNPKKLVCLLINHRYEDVFTTFDQDTQKYVTKFRCLRCDSTTLVWEGSTYWKEWKGGKWP